MADVTVQYFPAGKLSTHEQPSGRLRTTISHNDKLVTTQVKDESQYDIFLIRYIKF